MVFTSLVGILRAREYARDVGQECLTDVRIKVFGETRHVDAGEIFLGLAVLQHGGDNRPGEFYVHQFPEELPVHVPAGVIFHREEEGREFNEGSRAWLQDEEVRQHYGKREKEQRLVDNPDAPEGGLRQQGEEEEGRALIDAVHLPLHVQHQPPFTDAMYQASEEEEL